MAEAASRADCAPPRIPSRVTSRAANPRRPQSRRGVFPGFAFAAAAIPASAQAHGFGQRYDLPIPLSLYIGGAAITVAISCAMLIFFVRAAPAGGVAATLDLRRSALGRALVASPVLAALRIAGVALYVLVVFAGLFGNQGPLKNIAPVAIWALWWVGMAYVSALLGDVWKLVNPLESIFMAAERLHSRWRPGKSFGPGWTLAEPVGAWPAVGLFLVFLWMEMAWEDSDHPAQLAAAILGYSALTWAGMLAFGRRRWLAAGEVFNRVFGVLARFAPTRLRTENGRVTELELRPYAVGLLAREPAGPSEIALILLVLAAVSFDGFMETPAWAAIADTFASLTARDAADPDFHVAMRTLGLLSAPLLFLAIYALFCRLIAWCGRPTGSRAAGVSAQRVAGLFVFTLVPIAIAYEVAHYFSFLAMAGQYFIALASDPLGLGWDLFGTANRFIRPGLVDARLVWYVSLSAIVTGHVAALYLAHLLSLREFADRRSAARSQWPMLALMVGYTMLSLWIIAQPIVTSRFS